MTIQKIIHPLTIDRLSCQCEETHDSLTVGIVKHRVLGQDGPTLESTGYVGRELNLRTLWAGNDYQNHETFLATCAMSGKTVELMHPVYGPMSGKISSTTVAHSGGDEDSVFIDIDFIEEKKSAMSAFAFANDIEATIKSKIGQAAINLETTLGEMLAGAVAGAIAAVEGAVNKFEAKAAAVQSQAAHVLATVKWGTNLPGRIGSAISGAVSAQAAAFEALRDSPTAFMANLAAAHEQAISLFPTTLEGAVMSVAYRALGTADLSWQAARLYSDDKARSTARTSAVNAPVMGAGGEFSATRNGIPVAMSATDVERVQDIVRQFATLKKSDGTPKKDFTGQWGLLADRTHGETIKAMIANLANHTAERARAGQALRQATITQKTGVYRICQMYGLNHRRAGEIVEINRIENPNRIEGKIWLPVN